MPSCFDPTSLLRLEMPDDELTCSGATLSKERCGNPINATNRALITQILARMSARDVVSMSKGLDDAFQKDLDDLVHLCLCLRYHQKGSKCQVPQLRKSFEMAILAWCARDRNTRRAATDSNSAEMVLNLPSVPTTDPVSSNTRPNKAAAVPIPSIQLRRIDKDLQTVQSDFPSREQCSSINAYHVNAPTSNMEPFVFQQRPVARMRRPGVTFLKSTTKKSTSRVDSDADIECQMANIFLASNSKYQSTEPPRIAKSATMNARPVSARTGQIITKSKLEPKCALEESDINEEVDRFTGSPYRQVCRDVLSTQHAAITPHSPAQTQPATLGKSTTSTTTRPADATDAAETVFRRSLPDICILCMEAIASYDPKGRAERIWCRAECGYNFHSACFEDHLEGKLQDDVECAHCDELWLWDQASLQIWERSV